MAGPGTSPFEPEPRRYSHYLRFPLQAVGLIAIGIILWAAVENDLNRWMAGAGIVLLGGLIAASVGNEFRASRQRRRESGTDTPTMPLADTLLANIPDPIILIDRRMVVVEANTAAQELLPTLRRGFPLSFSIRSPDVLGGVDQVVHSGKALKVEHTEKLPAERAFELQISLIGSNEQWVLLFFRDLTSARRLEKMRVDFIANVSHELRTPLASVIGFIETIQGPAKEDAAARAKFLGVMMVQARRMARLIDDLLSLSRVELHVHVKPETPLDLESTVRQIIPALMPLAAESGVEISFAAENGPFVINGDRDEMLRVAENLIENAIKYGAEGGKIDVALQRLPAESGIPARVEFSVRDYGEGISPDHLARLTERFYRTDSEASRKKGGTGLGLAIVKHIIIRHRGKFLIESEPGNGATFRVQIPARRVDASEH